MTNPLFWIGMFSASSYLFILFARSISTLRYLTSHPECEESAAAVTILQPILGGDNFLETALLSNVQTSPDNARFLWLMDDDDLPGLKVTKELNEQYPEKTELLICPACPSNLNPKIWKLNQALPHVKTDFIAVLDDDTMLGENQLSIALAAMNDCELFTGLPHYEGGSNFWSSLVAHFVNNNSILTYLSLLNWMQPISINGMFYVVRSQTLQDNGGLASIQHELCDDFALAKLIRKNSGRIQQGVTSQRLQTSIQDGKHYMSVMHRWFVFANVLLSEQTFFIRGLLIIVLGIPPLLFWGSSGLLAGGTVGIILFVALLTLRHCTLRLLHQKVFHTKIHFNPLLSILSEFLQIVHVLHAQVSSVIRWRRHLIRVKSDGSFVNLNEEAT